MSKRYWKFRLIQMHFSNPSAFTLFRRGTSPRQAWLEPGHPAGDYSSDIRHWSRLPQLPPSSDFGATRRVLVSTQNGERDRPGCRSRRRAANIPWSVRRDAERSVRDARAPYFTRELEQLHPDKSASQRIPFLQGNGTFQNGFDLPEEHTVLRHGVFGIGGNGLAMLAQDHELVAGAGIGAVEAERGVCG